MKSSYIIGVILFAVLMKTTASSGSEGTEFVVVFPPMRSDSHNGICDIYIRAEQDTQVSITNSSFTSSHNIFANVTFRTSYDYTYRLEDAGIYQLAILIEAADDVTVMASNDRRDGLMQTSLVLPLREKELQNYMIISYPTTYNWICSPRSSASFFTVAPFQDNTQVSISKTVNGVVLDTFYLNRLDVYINRTLTDEDVRRYDFTGYYVTADKPVSVTAGNACADVNTDQDPGPIWASMPTAQQSGTSYISHTLNYNGDYDQTILRVLALEDDTQVWLNNDSFIQYGGQFVDYSVISNTHAVIECARPCRVAQYSFNDHFQNRAGSAVFMVILPPTDYYTHQAIFNIPWDESSSYGMTDYMSIIYLTETPAMYPMYYDEVPLTGWTVHEGQGFSSLETEITGPRDLQHTLVTSDDEDYPRFVALIHGQSEDARGYGYISDFRQ